MIGLSDEELEWFESYLVLHSHTASVHDVSFEVLCLLSGVPLSAVIDLLIFSNVHTTSRKYCAAT